MKPKISIRKVLIAAAWLAVGITMLTLLVAANRKERGYLCKDVAITIKGVGESFYIDKNDIAASLKKAANNRIVGQPLPGIKLAVLEKALERNEWIQDAELYFDSRNVLHVLVTERQPVARVFTTTGNSFYIDTGALRMPLLEGVSVRVPVVTNFPAIKRLNKKDSALLNDVKLLAHFLRQDEFWNAQVAQIDIVDRQNFEIIPTVGNHVIRIGNADDVEAKFNRLLVFYRQVLSKTGFDKYSVLDVQYDGQVVGVQKGVVSKVDSVQLQKNIEELMKRSQMNEEAQQPMDIDSASVSSTAQKYPDTTTNNTSKEKPIIRQPSNTAKTTNTKPNPTLSKTAKNEKPVVKKATVKTEAKKPKALMQRRN